MKVSRARHLPVDRTVVWEVAGDPYHLPRWWPRTQRVESVTEAGWTSVLGTDRGRTVRADYRVVASERPRWRVWAQEIAGTPFERLMDSSEVHLTLDKDGERGTRVSLELRQRLRGWGRMGGFMVRRAARRQLDEALTALEGLMEPDR